MNILCDIDGVVADLMYSWVDMHNSECAICTKMLDYRKITQWNIHELVACGKDIYKYLWRRDLYDTVTPIPGSRVGIRTLRALGHRVIFVTSGMQPAKIEWLTSRGFIDPRNWQTNPDWVICTDKSLIKGDVMIDDYPVNLAGFSGHKILFDAPYNKDEFKYPRAYNWGEVVNSIRALG